MGEVSDDPYRIHHLYDLEYAAHDEDIDWYVDRARAARGPVLELGCGTGRLTLPIARAGVSVLGVDRAPDMLAGLSTKLQHGPAAVRQRVRIQQADYTDLSIDGRFAGVLWPFNALHHCTGPAQVASMLDRITGWLAPGARLSLDCYLPDRTLYDRDPAQRFEFRTFVDPRSGETLTSWEQGWWDEAAMTHHVQYVYEHLGGRQERTRLALRMYELPTLRALLADAGFALLREAQDFEGTPLGPRPLKWVAVALPR